MNMSVIDRIRDVLGLPRMDFYAELPLSDGRVMVTESDEFSVGSDVQVIDDEGTSQMLKAGTYETEDGTKFTVSDDSTLEEIEKDEDPEETKMSRQAFGTRELVDGVFGLLETNIPDFAYVSWITAQDPRKGFGMQDALDEKDFMEAYNVADDFVGMIGGNIEEMMKEAPKAIKKLKNIWKRNSGEGTNMNFNKYGSSFDDNLQDANVALVDVEQMIKESRQSLRYAIEDATNVPEGEEVDKDKVDRINSLFDLTDDLMSNIGDFEKEIEKVQKAGKKVEFGKQNFSKAIEQQVNKVDDMEYQAMKAIAQLERMIDLDMQDLDRQAKDGEISKKEFDALKPIVKELKDAINGVEFFKDIFGTAQQWVKAKKGIKGAKFSKQNFGFVGGMHGKYMTGLLDKLDDAVVEAGDEIGALMTGANPNISSDSKDLKRGMSVVEEMEDYVKSLKKQAKELIGVAKSANFSKEEFASRPALDEISDIVAYARTTHKNLAKAKDVLEGAMASAESLVIEASDSLGKDGPKAMKEAGNNVRLLESLLKEIDGAMQGVEEFSRKSQDLKGYDFSNQKFNTMPSHYDEKDKLEEHEEKQLNDLKEKFGDEVDEKTLRAILNAIKEEKKMGKEEEEMTEEEKEKMDEEEKKMKEEDKEKLSSALTTILERLERLEGAPGSDGVQYSPTGTRQFSKLPTTEGESAVEQALSIINNFQ